MQRVLATASQVSGTLIAVDERVHSAPDSGLSMHGESKIDMDDRIAHHHTRMYRPVVRYTAPDGRAHVLKTGFSSSKLKEPGGEAVVVFHRDTPEKAQLLMFFWFWTQLIAVFGLVILLIGLGATLLLLVT